MPMPPRANPSAAGIFQGRRLLIGGGPSTGLKHSPPIPAPPVAPAPPAEPPLDLPATVAARKLAGELGVDLARVTGTGAHGEVTAPDVRAAAKKQRRK